MSSTDPTPPKCPECGHSDYVVPINSEFPWRCNRHSFTDELAMAVESGEWPEQCKVSRIDLDNTWVVWDAEGHPYSWRKPDGRFTYELLQAATYSAVEALGVAHHLSDLKVMALREAIENVGPGTLGDALGLRAVEDDE